MNKIFNNMDFRLNKQAVLSYLQFFLARSSTAETLKTRNNVEYVLCPGIMPKVKYGVHLNAQEINATRGFDCCSFVADKFVNGYYIGSFWINLKFNNFSISLYGENALSKNDYATDEYEMTKDYYNFLYLIFNNSYKQALLTYLECQKSEELKLLNKKLISNLQKSVQTKKVNDNGKIFSPKSYAAKMKFFKNNVKMEYKQKLNLAASLNAEDFVNL